MEESVAEPVSLDPEEELKVLRLLVAEGVSVGVAEVVGISLRGEEIRMPPLPLKEDVADTVELPL